MSDIEVRHLSKSFDLKGVKVEALKDINLSIKPGDISVSYTHLDVYKRQIREYEATKKMLRNTPAMYKKAYPFLKEVDSLALANVQLHLEKAYKMCIRDRLFPDYFS